MTTTERTFARHAHRGFLRDCLDHPVVAPVEEPMSDLEAILLIEGGEADDGQLVDAFQCLLDSGTVWHLQGFYSRTARELIEAGFIVERN